MPAALDAVQNRWREIVAPFAAGAEAARVLGEIVSAYSAPERHYHGLAHIAALLVLSGQYADQFHDRDAVDLAIVLHDIVYDATRTDNEEQSAVLAADRLQKLGCAPDLMAKVEMYIRATQHAGQTQDGPESSDLTFLLDFDLAVLGADREAYVRYATDIRREYAAYSDLVYRAGRARVLRHFLARPQIYSVPVLRERWEPNARANLAWELDTLSGGGGAAP